MDNQADDQEPNDVPPVSPRELEEALKWLEELTARPGAAADGAKLGAEESPFHGLIEGEGSDMPDWLRESASNAALVGGDADAEQESRLDWLAKMAERESIEELPTLEWRHLSDPMQQIVRNSLGSSPTLEEDTLPPPDSAAEAAAVAALAGELTDAVELQPALAATDTAEAISPVLIQGDDEPLFADESLAVDLPSDVDEPLAVIVETVVVAEVARAADEDDPVSAEHLIDALPQDEELPPIDDLDAAMAWIEELAASQDAPIEDVPSVADRALASKLMLEAGLSAEAIDLSQRGEDLPFGDLSLLEGSTPVNAFVEAEDFADTIMLIETISAEQNAPAEALSPPSPNDEPPPDAAFQDAMAFLDELAAAQPVVDEVADAGRTDAEEVVAVAAVAAVTDEIDRHEPAELTPNDVLDAEDAPWAQVAAAGVAVIAADDRANPDVMTGEAPIVLSHATGQPEEALTMDEVAVAMGDADGRALEAHLSVLDALALPAGRSLAEIDDHLQQSGVYPMRRDLTRALAWLEAALGPAPARPTDDLGEADDLIARMPDDPDAVLAWLEEMAHEDVGVVDTPAVPSAQLAPAATDIAFTPVEVDLAAMPDDPDEAMRWLEGLAAAPPSVEAAPSPAVEPDASPKRPRRRRKGRRAADERPESAAAIAAAAVAADMVDREVEAPVAEAPVLETAAAEVIEAQAAVAPAVVDVSTEVIGDKDSHHVAVRPRRRTRRVTVAAADETAAPAVVSDQADAPEQPHEEPARPPEKPKSWIDLMRPLE